VYVRWLLTVPSKDSAISPVLPVIGCLSGRPELPQLYLLGYDCSASYETQMGEVGLVVVREDSEVFVWFGWEVVGRRRNWSCCSENFNESTTRNT
jgi:hypothetical protein